jgi:hypothetical protein
MLWCLNEAIASARELIVWGGSDLYTVNTAGRYDPSIDSWTGTTITNAPTDRTEHTAVWTGSAVK